ncbi:hypothetical protein N7495_004763 [Penicillium taxi]|uniref:uncharacterized protein n=1 Tax=Penicillium taxi TaxID=168475 RepID=UPI002545491A|nr:uncharacterized protein N7495_004763 [Penicillium taxi]KAJ5900019.1 hypothetical protein N7495_004763 [Penicillium taxi]
MATVASATIGAPLEHQKDIRKEDWSNELIEPQSHDTETDRVNFRGDGLNTGVRVLGDGRLDIRIKERRPSIARLLTHTMHTPVPSDLEPSSGISSRKSEPTNEEKEFPIHMNIAIQVIGSRGDIQPFVAIGKELKSHGHRVRLATHLSFRELVLDAGLEFFNIGGDPEELMSFMVNNSGLLPRFDAFRNGDIQKRRRDMRLMINSFWNSCWETGDGTHLHQIKEDLWSDTADYRTRPFVADVIIANPPSLSHIHCAQRLGIPLHIMFTMPWTPTQYFSHPLAILHQHDCKPSVANFVSYAIVEMMVWEGLGDIVNKFRKLKLALDPLDGITAPSLIHRLKIPVSYLWSPAILSKPADWGDNIDICGFSFLPSKPDYTPPEEIVSFLKAGPTPIYIGFGSIVVNNQKSLTNIVFEAIKRSGQRAIVSRGWGNIGVDDSEVPDNILVIGSCPHDWLFRHVSCVIHHGGAGTTAAGLALGKPTIIIPFFGDQQFWGDIVARAGAGPAAIPYKQLTIEKLSDGIDFALKSETLEKAQKIAEKMQDENGVRDAVRSFYRQLDPKAIQCEICPSQPAVWHVKHTEIGLGAFAAAILVESGRIRPEELVLNRPMEYDTYRDPTGPITAGAQVLLGAIANFMTSLADVPTEIVQEIWTAGRAMSHPHKPFDPHKKWQRRASEFSEDSDIDKSVKDSASSSRSSKEFSLGHFHRRSTQQKAERAEAARIEAERLEAENIEAERVEDSDSDDTSDSDDDTHTGDLLPVASLERNRSLQLAKSQSMSSEVLAPTSRSIFFEALVHGSRMSKKFINLLIWLPTDLSLSLAKGFRNLPKVWHDPMVQPIPKVIGIRSGFRAAGQEFIDSFYYGFTGLFTQPQYEYRMTGGKGIIKGVGKGVGGVIMKPPAGLLGLAGYPLKGIRRHLLDSLGKSQDNQIIASRITQGHEEMRASTSEQRAEVARQWEIIEQQLKKQERPCSMHFRMHPLHGRADSLVE